MNGLRNHPHSKLPDLTTCDREPINTPGHIQPHGVLVATVPGGLQISHVSQNAQTALGLKAEALLGTDLVNLVGSSGLAAMEQALRDTSYAPANVLRLTLPIPVQPLRKILLHRHRERMIVELEDLPWHDESGAALMQAQSIIASLRLTQTPAELCSQTARTVRLLTGFDRVMVYQFDHDGHGKVIAEDKAPDLEAYLHLNYPASDIPQQARRLYVMQRVRNIADVDYRPVPVISRDGAELDMSLCGLRGISPVHLEYMRNMGVSGSFSISLLQDDKLWGMIIGHHTQPRHMTVTLRAVCDIIGQLVSMLLQRAEETETLAIRTARSGIIHTLRNGIDLSVNLADGLHGQSGAMLSLMDASGALIRCNGLTRLIGNTPPEAASCAIADAVLRDSKGGISAFADAGKPGGIAQAHSDTAAGILAMPLSGDPTGVIAWFRPETSQNVRWAGNPAKNMGTSAEAPRMSPRQSFAAWTELKLGSSEPWTNSDLQAAEHLQRDIALAMLFRTAAGPAHFPAFDPLTGQPVQAAPAGQFNAIEKSQAVIEFALDGTILRANENFAGAVGYEAEELRGKHHRLLVDPDDWESPEYLQLWEQVSDGKHQAGEYQRVGKDGGKIWLQATYNPVLGRDGKPYKIVKLATDITAQKMQAAELAARADAIARSQIDGVVVKTTKLEAALAEQVGALERLNEKLNLTAQRLALATDSGGIGVWDWDIHRDRMSWDDRMRRLYDVPPGSLESTYDIWSSRLHPEDRAAAEQAVAEAITGISDFRTSFRVVWRDGSVRHISGTALVMRNEAGDAQRMIGVNLDVTAQFAQNLALYEATVRTKLAADSGGIGIWEWDILSGDVLWDTRVRQLYDVVPVDRTITYDLWKESLHPEDRAAAEQALADGAAGISKFDTSFRVVWHDGSVHHIRAVAEVTRDAAGNAQRMVGVNWDVTKEVAENLILQEMTTRMTRVAHHDSLTGLPNRLLLSDRIDQAITMALRHGKKAGVLFLDLDGFKHINDSLGHEIGDKLLVSVSSRLQECVRDSDTVSRQGGDEFVVLLAEMNELEDAGIIAGRFLRAVSENHVIDGHDLHVTASIGISVYPEDGCDAATLFKAADAAMYKVKASGRHGYQFFETAMKVGAIERQYIEENLRRAFKNGEFALHYQPKINIRTGAITGAEALIRWNHPERGSISPATFIPVAEDCGLIRTLGSWVLREACEQGQKWIEAGLPPITMAVNVSPIELGKSDFLGDVRAILKDTGFDPKYLELEMTEGVLIRNLASTEATFKALKEMGVRLAIDDFGTGYSSLSYLTKFPIDTIKIDQSFVRQISTDPKESAVVTAVISMAHSLNLVVVAEGVETRAELDFLSNLGCDEAQGYYFSRPIAAAFFTPLLSNAATIH